MYAAAKFTIQKVQASGSLSDQQPYAEGTLIVAVLLKRLQGGKDCAAVKDDTPAEKLWLLAAKGRL